MHIRYDVSAYMRKVHFRFTATHQSLPRPKSESNRDNRGSRDLGHSSAFVDYFAIVALAQVG